MEAQPTPRPSSAIDREILELFALEATRDRAFSLLMKHYQKRLYWHIRKMVIDHDEADDLVQETLIKAWRGLEKFRDESALYTWLYRIATNVCLTHLTNKRKRFFLPIHDITPELERQLQAAVPLEQANTIEYKLQQALIRLPDKQRLVFNLRYYDEMPYEEMSQVLGTSVGALKASYHHAYHKVEQFLKNH
ncbi:MAG: RNA polymerase subunit sigma [Sphingobacteriaceae bacterium]|nr:RNA polymerase subunit sigma [Sphingobacteriaceae bacterium]